MKMNKRVLLLALTLVALLALFGWNSGRASEQGNIWSPPEVVLDDLSQTANLLRFQRSTDGRVHILAYLDNTFGVYTLVYTWRHEDGNWNEAEPIAEFYTPTSNSNPAMAVSDDGSVHVVWWDTELDMSEEALYYAQRSPGGGWSSPLELEPGLLVAFQLSITAVEGHIFVRWTSYNGIFLISRNPQGEWSQKEQVDSSQEGASSTVHVQDLAGNFHFLWENDNQDDESQRAVYHRILSAAGVWGPIVRVSPEISDPTHYIGHVTADIDGNQVYVAWEQGDYEDIYNPMPVVYTAEWSGSSWSTATPLTTPGDWFVLTAAVTNGFASLIAVNSEPSPTTHLWTRPAGGVWTEETVDFASGSVRLANEAGRLHFVWYSGGSPPMQYRWRDQAGNYSTIETIDSLNIQTAIFQSNQAHLDLAWQKDGNIYYSHAEPLGPFDHYLPAVIH
jgi:hypothetical protein